MIGINFAEINMTFTCHVQTKSSAYCILLDINTYDVAQFLVVSNSPYPDLESNSWPLFTG